MNVYRVYPLIISKLLLSQNNLTTIMKYIVSSQIKMNVYHTYIRIHIEAFLWHCSYNAMLENTNTTLEINFIPHACTCSQSVHILYNLYSLVYTRIAAAMTRRKYGYLPHILIPFYRHANYLITRFMYTFLITSV